jgi:nitroreductase
VDNSQPELFARVKETYHRDWINDVPAIILCMKAEAECWTRRYDSKSHADIDLAIAIEHLCLAATEQGLGTCWVCNFDINQFHEIVPMPEGLEPVALIPIGYPADEQAPKVRKSMEDVWQ